MFADTPVGMPYAPHIGEGSSPSDGPCFPTTVWPAITALAGSIPPRQWAKRISAVTNRRRAYGCKRIRPGRSPVDGGPPFCWRRTRVNPADANALAPYETPARQVPTYSPRHARPCWHRRAITHHRPNRRISENGPEILVNVIAGRWLIDGYFALRLVRCCHTVVGSAGRCSLEPSGARPGPAPPSAHDWPESYQLTLVGASRFYRLRFHRLSGLIGRRPPVGRRPSFPTPSSLPSVSVILTVYNEIRRQAVRNSSADPRPAVDRRDHRRLDGSTDGPRRSSRARDWVGPVRSARRPQQNVGVAA